MATVKDFTRTTFHKYEELDPQNSAQLNYVDSLDNKPSYIVLEIMDKVRYQEELLSEVNEAIVNYIKIQKDARIVTKLQMTIPLQLLNTIQQAEILFLVNEKEKQYHLELVRNNQIIATIDFNEGEIFGYELSRFCWGVDRRNQIVPNGIVDGNQSCASDSYKSAAKAEKKTGTNFKL